MRLYDVLKDGFYDVLRDGFVIEAFVAYSPELMTFDASNARIKKAFKEGFSRHLRPEEFVELLIRKGEGAHFEKLSNQLGVEEPEWVSAAFERKDDILKLYLDPELVTRDEGSSYSFRKKRPYFSICYEFDISRIQYKSGNAVQLKKLENVRATNVYQGIALEEFDGDEHTVSLIINTQLERKGLVEVLCGRPLKKLPREWVNGESTSFVWLPDNGELMPLAIDMHKQIASYDVAASRGCIEICSR